MKVIKEGDLEAICYNDDIEQYAEAQVKNIMSQDWCQKYKPKIRLMPDVHPGKIGPIGLTMNADRDMPIMPGLLGPDIGCGATVYSISGKRMNDFQRVDKIIKEKIPVGNKIRDTYLLPLFSSLKDKLDWDRVVKSFATLGGGNHFIEIDKSDNGEYYLIIHSGSRQFGKQVYDYFMREGQKQLKEKGIDIPYEMTYLEGDLKKQYIICVNECDTFASMSRMKMANIICTSMRWDDYLKANKVHNTISILFDDISFEVPKARMLIFKGAQFSMNNDNYVKSKVIIPVNMKEGCILGTGKSNPDWNFAAPHGSGRVYKRSDVANIYTVNQFKKDMTGIYSTSIRKDTLDEAPIAYRSMDQILPLIKDTVDVKEILHPVYNFKAGKED